MNLSGVVRKEVIGDCILYQGDSYTILPQLSSFDLILTDPPYEIHAGKGGGCFGNRAHLVNTGGFTDSGCDYSFLDGVKNWFCFCSFKQLIKLLTIANNNERSELLTWVKTNPVPTCNNKYLPDVEYIVHGFSKGFLWGKYTEKSHIISYPCGAGATDHPNEKPLPVIDRLLSVGFKKGKVCDPFMGSGTTGVACARKGKQFTGIEREAKYFDIACERIATAYKTRPRLFEVVETVKASQGSLF